MNGQVLFRHQPPQEYNMEILFILIDDKLDAHYIISENVNNKEERGK
jgi:hypothetical protein